ncbi:MAG: hypothetical protein HYS32_00500 [Candidatus Woesearchaeota archaeon]|nr:MAG: hypothetical protein HYS32_00500 [Candidatus Woesearchaeota archaeon]
MKCDICNENVEETFLGKIIGTFVRINSKRKVVCANCQAKYKDLKEKLS